MNYRIIELLHENVLGLFRWSRPYKLFIFHMRESSRIPYIWISGHWRPTIAVHLGDPAAALVILSIAPLRLSPLAHFQQSKSIPMAGEPEHANCTEDFIPCSKCHAIFLLCNLNITAIWRCVPPSRLPDVPLPYYSLASVLEVDVGPESDHSQDCTL